MACEAGQGWGWVMGMKRNIIQRILDPEPEAFTGHSDAPEKPKGKPAPDTPDDLRVLMDRQANAIAEAIHDYLKLTAPVRKSMKPNEAKELHDSIESSSRWLMSANHKMNEHLKRVLNFNFFFSEDNKNRKGDR